MEGHWDLSTTGEETEDDRERKKREREKELAHLAELDKEFEKNGQI
jgi:hypothetical protein